MDRLRAVLQIRGKSAFRPPCGSPVTVIVMRAWLAVTGVPPVVHCRKTGLSAVALSAMEGVSCRSGIFGYLYMDEIMTIRTVLPFGYKHIKEVPTAMAVSFITLWSLWAFLLLVLFLKSAFSRQKAFWGFYGENGFLTTINKAKNRLGDKKEVKPSSPLSNFCNKH